MIVGSVTLSPSILIPKPLTMRNNLARSSILHDCFLGPSKSVNIWSLILLTWIETVVCLLRTQMLLILSLIPLKCYRRVSGRNLERRDRLFADHWD